MDQEQQLQALWKACQGVFKPTPETMRFKIPECWFDLHAARVEPSDFSWGECVEGAGRREQPGLLGAGCHLAAVAAARPGTGAGAFHTAALATPHQNEAASNRIAAGEIRPPRVPAPRAWRGLLTVGSHEAEKPRRARRFSRDYAISSC